MSLQRGINLRALAEKMGQCSGAEVRGICTEAGMYALRERRQHVTQEDFEFAVAKVCRVVQDKWPVLTLVFNRYSRRTKRGICRSTSSSRNLHHVYRALRFMDILSRRNDDSGRIGLCGWISKFTRLRTYTGRSTVNTGRECEEYAECSTVLAHCLLGVQQHRVGQAME